VDSEFAGDLCDRRFLGCVLYYQSRLGNKSRNRAIEAERRVNVPQPTNFISITTDKETANFVEEILQILLDDEYFPHYHEQQHIIDFLTDIRNGVEEWNF
jgi:hypothetical protein